MFKEKIFPYIFNDNIKEAYIAYLISMFFFIITLPFSDIHSFFVFLILLFYPVLSANYKKIDYFDYGVNNINWKKSFKYLFLWSIFTFIPYVIIVLLINGKNIFSFINNLVLPKDFYEKSLYHIVAVGFSEEFFYRGYLQKLVQKKYNKFIIKSLGLDTGVILVSLLFAIGHFFTYFTFFSFLTFFPSLVFGILKNKTNHIFASMIYHGFSNIIMIIFISNL